MGKRVSKHFAEHWFPLTHHVLGGANNWLDITERATEKCFMLLHLLDRRDTGTTSLPAGRKQSAAPNPATVLHASNGSPQEAEAGVSEA